MDHDMSPFSTDHWLQQYPNSPIIIQPTLDHDHDHDHDQPSDSTTTPLYTDSSPRSTTTSKIDSKPIRRRSRASRKTPTTVLNASPTEFRALVQRFTGCDSKDNLALASVANLPKGPVNIDFSRNDIVNHDQGSSRYEYFDNQVRLPLQGEQMQQLGGLSNLQAGAYRMENASVVYESIDESSIMATPSDHDGSHRYF
ncbi:uncharacterized protein [Rutidosis leptorrhynchoides]|uniref:uncharacterized protein n=1 Tax=Rutidosis leptorrhynchoides TaxID=125765 RepID=UPI003A98F55C